MDCVASCPNEALSFGLARPTIAVDRAGSRSAAAAERRWDLSWAEEVALAAVGVAALLAVRGIYVGVPLLFASGIAACCTFLAWKSWRVLRDRDVSFHGARLRFRGRIGASGLAWLAASAVALGGVAYVGALNGVTWLADRSDAQVTLPAEAIFNENAQEPDGWSVLPVPHRITPLLVASKTLSYAANMQAARLAAEAGADTALLVDADTDAVLECPVASFVWIEGEDLVAPPLETGILDSITRRLIAEVAPLHVRARTLDDLAQADGALVISTVLESRIVREVKGIAQYDVHGRRITEIADGLRELCMTGDPDGGRAVPA